jgi:hypothetical protein
MSKNEQNNSIINDKNEAAPPLIKAKKHIKYKIVHESFKKSRTEFKVLKTKKDSEDKNTIKEDKNIGNITSRPSNDSWSIFAPNFATNPNKQEKTMNNSVATNNITDNEENLQKDLISKSLFDFSPNDDDKITKLEKEINVLKETNQNIFNLIMEKEKENKVLINDIDKYKMESIDKLSNYLNFIEELGKKFKFTNDDEEEINLDIKNNLNETNELNIELNKNNQLKKILAKKNDEFNEINNAVKKLIFEGNSPLLNEPNNDSDNNNINNINNIDEQNANTNTNNLNNSNKGEDNEIIKLKNDYNKLKEDYNKLLEKYQQEEKKNKGKNRIKFIYKDLPQNIKQKYEKDIQGLIVEGEEIKKKYGKEIDETNMTIGSLKVEFLNKQFEKETKLLNNKKKIKTLIKQCKSLGIKLNNEILNIK